MQAIGNMDETPMTFDMPLDRTVDAIEKKHTCQNLGHEKDRFTVVLACLADGIYQIEAHGNPQAENNA